MSETPVGKVAWVDLTVNRADEVKDFYTEVVGWSTTEVDMGDYSDYGLHSPGQDDMVAGLCHARGANAELPPQWLVYITVADVDHSAARCRELGGSVLVGPRAVGGGRFCVIRDPAGAVCSLFAPESQI